MPPRTRGRRKIRLILLVGALVLASCGSDPLSVTTADETTADAGDAAEEATSSDDETAVADDSPPRELPPVQAPDRKPPTIDTVFRSCGNARFSGPLDEPLQTTPVDDEIRSIMDEVDAEGGEDGLGWFDDGHEWSVTSRGAEHVILFGQSELGQHSFALLRPGDGTWRMTTWGGCHLRFEAEGFPSVSWKLTGELDSSSTSIEISVQEDCASDPPLQPAEITPIVVGAEGRMTVVLFGRALPAPTGEFSDMTCSLGATPLTMRVELAEPLGDRQLHDGAARGDSLRS